MNPCKCRCSSADVQRYRDRITYEAAPKEAVIAPPPDALIVNGPKKAVPAGGSPENETSAPAGLPAPEADKVYSFLDMKLHEKDLMGKVVRVELAPKKARKVDLHNGRYLATMTDKNTKMPGFTGSVDIEKDALDKMGLDDGSATKPLFIYIFMAKEKLTGLARYKAVGTHFEPGNEGKGVYSW